MLECIKNVAYDQFYCEHIYVFSTIALNKILDNFELEIFDIKKTSTHGGSNRYFIKKKVNRSLRVKKSVLENIIREKKYGLHKFETYKKFAKKVLNSKKKLNLILNRLKEKNKKIIGYGATAKSCTVLNYCKISDKSIDYFYDTTSYKIGKYLPGSKIKIKKYRKLTVKEADHVFLGAWNFREEIFKKEKNFINNGGKFITHIPVPRII